MHPPRPFLIILLTACFACSKQKKIIPPATTPDYDKAVSYYGVKNDSSFFYFYKVASNSTDSLQVAVAYNYMAVIQSFSGDYFGSQESLLQSLNYLNERNEKDQYCLTADYNELGRTSENLRNYGVAIEYYDKALGLSTDNKFKSTILNNKAVTYQRLGDYGNAIAIYRSAIEESKHNSKEYARVMSNLARVNWLNDPSYPAITAFWTALEIREKEKDSWGLNASFAHLSDYYANSKPDSALFYAKRMFENAKLLNSPDDEIEALQKLIKLDVADRLRQHFSRYYYLSDSLQTARAVAKNQFALIRYEAEKNKADNLLLQKDNSDKRVQIIKQRVFLYGIILMSVCLAIAGLAWYRRRKARIMQETQHAIRENQLRISQKVHDLVANGLYKIMTEIELGDTGRERLLDKIEILYEKSRDISYEHTIAATPNFHEVITAALMSFSSPTTRVLIAGNGKDIWEETTTDQKNNLQQVLQELMVNMKKHSLAQNVSVRFERSDDGIRIHYTDDGIGVSKGFQYGNGLASTENRIADINGHIIFDTDTEKGLKIKIFIPIP